MKYAVTSFYVDISFCESCGPTKTELQVRRSGIDFIYRLKLKESGTHLIPIYKIYQISLVFLMIIHIHFLLPSITYTYKHFFITTVRVLIK